MPAPWSCDTEGCQAPAVQLAGDCLLCGKHFCRLHLQDRWHKCPKPELNWDEYDAQYDAAEARRLDELCQRINGVKLCARASELRCGSDIPCTIDLSPKRLEAMMGTQNCHAEITFADGVVWLARFRLSSPVSPPSEVGDYALQSEVATMKFLECHTRIPSPRVFDWACESDPANAIGVGYILMEKLNGSPLDWQRATPAQREKIVRQLVDIMIEIERHPFDQLGSLVATTATPGPFASASRAQISGLVTQSGEDGRPLGPFCSSQVAFKALVKAHLLMIAGGKTGTAENAVNVFLAHRFRLDILNRAWKQTATQGLGGEKFFLKHADDKGDHILVNADFDIIGIIDWQFCCTASKAEAFSSPRMMWLEAGFYDGCNELAEEELLLARLFRERGRDDLAAHVLDGRKVQRFLFALGPVGASIEDTALFACLFMGLERAFARPYSMHEITEEEQWETWKASALKKWKHDRLLQHVLRSTVRLDET